MTRRELFQRSLRGALAATLVRRPGLAQQPDSARRAVGGDRLYDPSVVQERAAATPADNDPVVKELEHRLKCTCGCNLDVYTCRTTDFTCTYSPALHRELLALRADGKTPDEVVELFVTKYGESILMAPKPEGFNLAGYLLPGTLVTAAGLLLVMVLLGRSRRAATAAAAATLAGGGGGREQGTPVPNPADDERLRRALAEVED